MKARDARWRGTWPARRKSYETQRENAMTIYRGLPVIALCFLVSLASCGSGGGDGAEDTGSLVTISETSGATNTVNVDVASTDTTDPVTDASISLTFTNESVVPDQTTATTLVLYQCSVSYTSNDLSAPALEPADCSFALTLEVDSSVDADVLLVPIATIAQFDNSLTTLPDHPVEYEAHYTFEFRNVPFDQSQIVRPSPIRFSMADFASTTTP